MSAPGDHRQARPARPFRVGTVLHTEWLTPRMVRVVLGGDGLAGFSTRGFTDAHVKLQLAQPGSDQPARRTYTVRRWDDEAGQLTIDFVSHGDEGLAGPWAVGATAGDQVTLQGPGGEYSPDPTADWHLFAGDASALPAIAASLERVPPGAPAYAFLEVDSLDEEQKLDTPGNLTTVWLDRSAADGGPELLADAIRETELPTGRVHAFVHGEAASVRAVRRHLLVERGVPRADLSVSGYWKRGRTEDGWRADKPEWHRQVSEDERAS